MKRDWADDLATTESWFDDDEQKVIAALLRKARTVALEEAASALDAKDERHAAIIVRALIGEKE